MKDRRQALTELGDHVLKLSSSMGGAWGQAKSALGDPVALDQFALQAVTVSQALGQLAERSQQLAEELLDGEDD
jgi:hypothetical protein